MEIVGNKERCRPGGFWEEEVEEGEEGEAICLRISSDGNARVARSVNAAWTWDMKRTLVNWKTFGDIGREKLYRPLAAPSNTLVHLPPIPLAQVQRARSSELMCLKDPNNHARTPDGKEPHRLRRDNLLRKLMVMRIGPIIIRRKNRAYAK